MTVDSIVVLRANAIGDFIFTLPALVALREAYPRARVVLLGKRWHKEFLPGRGIVDEIVELPRIPGVTAPAEEAEDCETLEGFCAGMRARGFDLAVQVFGGGRYSNPFMRRLGAACTIGLRSPGAAPLDRWLPYLVLQNERLRFLEVATLAGAGTGNLDPRLRVLEADRADLVRRVRLPDAPVAVLQPGATDPRRRWPAERFAAIGDALAEAGAVVAINGSEAERPLTAAVAGAMRRPALDLAGVLSVSSLAALLAHAHLVVSNDTGPLHLAQAVGTATVGIFWLTNLLLAAPLVSTLHRQALDVEAHCPVCGTPNIHVRCSHDPSFVAGVAVSEVEELALPLWRSELERRRGAAVPA
jgi:ADP-heptose:LPS heptosyltransferase